MTESIHFILPGLLAPGMQVNAMMPALSCLLSKSNILKVHENFESRLSDVFFLNNAVSFPFSSLSALGAGLRMQTPFWINVDLVSLEVAAQGIFLRDYLDLKLTPEKIENIERALSPLFDEDGMQLYLKSQSGFLNLKSLAHISTHTLLSVLAKNLYQRLPSGPEGPAWQRLFTECQMVLQRLSVEPVNSVWFWGEGALPEQMRTDVDILVSDELFVKGIADLTHTIYYSSFIENNLIKNTLTESTMAKIRCVSWMFEKLIRHNKLDEWCLLARKWDAEYFQPLLDLLKRGKVQEILIEAGDGRLFVIKPRNLYYFWRRNQYATHTDY